MNFFEIPLGASAWILSEAAMERLGWVLLHSLWQFLLIAVLALAVLHFAKRSSASLRYVILVFTMTVCVVSPLATWFSQPRDTIAVANEMRKDEMAVVPTELTQLPLGASDEVAILADGNGISAEHLSTSRQPSVGSSHAFTEASYWWVNTRDSLRPWLTPIVTAWILGVVICAMRPLLSWIAIRRLRRVGTTPVSQELTELMLRLSDRLAVRRTVEILQSTLVHVPLVVGYVRPMILLPVSLLTNLPTSQLEAIIAHELAHVRRHDFLVNFMQTIVETLFFYHPAIWWLSHRIRIERENCCDDLVIQSLGNRVEYGRALVAVEQLRAESNGLALGISDGSMLARIRRIAGHSGNSRNSSSWSVMSVFASSLPVVVIIGLISWHSVASSPAQIASDPVLDEPISEESFSDEIMLKLAREDAHQGKWYFIDLDQGKLRTPPFDVDIDATRFPYLVNKPSEEELSDWLKRDGVDLILRSSIYRPDPKGAIERNEIQVRSVRTLLKELPSGLLQLDDKSWAWKATLDDVLNIFGAKDDAVHVVGFIPNATAVDIRPESPVLRSFRTASNQLGLFLLEQPSSTNDELTLRIVYAANKDTPLDDLRFGPDDIVSGLESLDHSAFRKSSKDPFIANFPNDVRVEFVGLSRGVGDIKAADKWWRPDGSPLEQAPEHRGVSGVLKEGEVENDDPFVRTVIHVHGIGDNNAVTATASMQFADSLKDESGGQYVAHFGYVDSPGWTRTFEVGVATEALSPKRWLDRDGKRSASKGESVKDPIAEDITIEKVGPESWGKGSNSKGGMTDPVEPGDQKMGSLSGTTQVTIRFPLAWREVDLRLFAIDKSGNSHDVDMTITLDPNDENADYKRLAKVIPVDYSEVDHFEYQFRVYRHWAIFENVSLWKGTQTEVVMKSETISTTPSDTDKVNVQAAPTVRSTAISNDSPKIPSSTNANADIEKTVLGILRKPFIDDPAKGTWQLGAHDIDVQWRLSDVPQRVDTIEVLSKVVDRTVASTTDERRLAIQFLSGADPTNLVPRLNKEIETAIGDPSKPFTQYHEIEFLGRMGEHSRSSLPLLMKLLDSKDRLAYEMAVDALVKIGARSLEVMNELAKHTDDPLTVYQLGRYGQTARALGPLFVNLLDSPSNEIHTYAAQALVKTGFDETRGYNILIADVAAGKSENRCRATTALAALGSQATSMIPRLRPFGNDPDPQVAKAVREAIARIEKNDRIFTHAEEATKREAALEASTALNPFIPFQLRILGGEDETPIAGIEIVPASGYGDSQKKFGPFLTDASGTCLCKLPQGFYTLHLKSKAEFPFLPYEKFWKELPSPGMKTLDLRVTGIGVEKWLGGKVREDGNEPAKSPEEPARITFTLLKPIELILRAVDIESGRGLPGAYFYFESAVAEDWAHPIDGANLGAAKYRDGQHAFDSSDYRTDADGYFKRFISDSYLLRSRDSQWGPKFGIWKAPEGYEAVEPGAEVAIDLPADNQSSVEYVFRFRRVK